MTTARSGPTKGDDCLKVFSTQPGRQFAAMRSGASDKVDCLPAPRRYLSLRSSAKLHPARRQIGDFGLAMRQTLHRGAAAGALKARGTHTIDGLASLPWLAALVLVLSACAMGSGNPADLPVAC